MSHLSVQTRLDTFYKFALLRSKTSTTSESSIDEQMHFLFKGLYSDTFYIYFLQHYLHLKFSTYLCSTFFFFFCLLGLLFASLIRLIALIRVTSPHKLLRISEGLRVCVEQMAQLFRCMFSTQPTLHPNYI
jgi:hypothetical protein